MIKRRIKKILFTKLAKKNIKSFGNGLTVNGRTVFNSNTIIGNDCHFNGLTVQGDGQVIIGDHFHSGYGCILITSNHNYMGSALPYDNTNITKDITIGKNVWLGLNVIVLPGITIGDGAIIQAGSVVVSNIPELGIAGGHPAKVFSYRDKEHYYSLESKGL